MKTNIKYPPAMEKAIQDVLIASATWRAADETDRANKNKILAENNFRYCYPEGTPGAVKEGEKITSEKADFLMSDADFEKYCQLVYEENLKCGLDSGGAGLTFWSLRKSVIDAENALIDIVAADIPQFTPEVVKRLKTSVKFREQFLKLTLGENYKV